MTLLGVGIIPGEKPKLPSAKWVWNHLLRTKAWVSYVLSMQNNFVNAAAPFAAALSLKEAGAQNGNIRAWTQPIMTDFNFGSPQLLDSLDSQSQSRCVCRLGTGGELDLYGDHCALRQ